MQRLGRTAFCGQEFDHVDMSGVLGWIAGRRASDQFAYVVTPNVDHVVRMSREVEGSPVRQAYRDADVLVNDSRILCKLGRLFGHDLTLVPGSDLLDALIEKRLLVGMKVAVIGGNGDTREKLSALLPGTEVVQHIPPMNLRHSERDREACADFVCRLQPDLTLIAVGSPQQELVANAIARRNAAGGTALCIGAAIEFVIGDVRRAPMWMRKASIEWLHRLLLNPQRHWRRYLIEGPRIFAIALREHKASARARAFVAKPEILAAAEFGHDIVGAACRFDGEISHQVETIAKAA